MTEPKLPTGPADPKAPRAKPYFPVEPQLQPQAEVGEQVPAPLSSPQTQQPPQPDPSVDNPLFVSDKPVQGVKGVKLYNPSGKEVKKEDYFFGGVMLPSFEKTCGKPVDREDLLVVFNKVFKPEDNILFYRQADKEVYIVIVPIKYSQEIGEEQNAIVGDFHKHAISFLNEGSVNLDSLRGKLEKIKTFVDYKDR